MESRLVTMSFFGSVSASSKNTLVSEYINVPFRTRVVRASFAPGVNRLMKLYFFISQDKEAPTTEEPKGTNLFAQLGQVRYITGDDEFKEFPHQVPYHEAGSYLKIYAVNDDTYDHTIDCQITIELLEAGGWQEFKESQKAQE